MCVCVSRHKEGGLIVNDGETPDRFALRRLSVKSRTAASHRNSEVQHKHFVIGIRKLHPLSNNTVLAGEVPYGSLPT